MKPVLSIPRSYIRDLDPWLIDLTEGAILRETRHAPNCTKGIIFKYSKMQYTLQLFHLYASKMSIGLYIPVCILSFRSKCLEV